MVERRRPAAATITSPLSSDLRRGDVDGHGLDEHAARRRLDVEAGGAERHGGGDLLGAVHLRARLGDPLLEGLPGRGDRLGGTSEAPSGRRNGRRRSSQRTLRTVTST